MRGFRAVLWVVASLVPAWLPGAAGAHEPNLTYGVIDGRDRAAVAMRFLFNADDLERAMGVTLTDGRMAAIPAYVSAREAEILDYLTANARLFGRDGGDCTLTEGEAVPELDAVLVQGRWDCSAVDGELLYRATLLLDLTRDARHLVRLGIELDAQQVPMDRHTVEINLDDPPGLGAVAVRYVRSGVEHIFIGFDHIAFIVALLLWAQRLWGVIKIVTAFTVAHSITLTMAVLDVIAIPIDIAEAAIAATIVYVAAENFFRRDMENRWVVAFLLGLVHGVGFASVLRDFGLPDEGLGVALAGFNVGVEIGQVAIVLVLIPLLAQGDRLAARLRGRSGPVEREKLVVHAMSLAIMSFGLWWLAERTILA